MSNRGRSRQRAGSTTEQRLTKPEKRALAKAARAKAAAARRRRQVITGTLAGLAVVGVVIAAFVYFGGSDGGGAGSAGATASASTDPRLASKPAVTKGTGELTKLTVTPLIEGNGPAAQAGQEITVHYVGVSYQTGAEFDSSWSRSQPYSFQLGAGNVIRGWDEGLVGVNVGSRVQLDIPSDLAYGDNPEGGRPAGPLRFVVDVLAVQ